MHSKVKGSVVLGCCLSMAATASLADTAEETTDNTMQLDEVIVTAQRREESLDKVPISITAVTQSTLNDLHIESLSDLATLVPGLYVNQGGPGAQDGQNVVIRGISNAGVNAPTTQFYIDETPVAIRDLSTAPSYSPQPYMFDLDRVEVLRGPQGTLFGASAMGGAIRFITPQPSLTNTSGMAKADVSFTEHGDPSYELGGAIGAPIIPGTLGFRSSAWFQWLGGFVNQEDPFTGAITKRNIDTADTYVIRPAVTWAPNENLTITPAAFLQHRHTQNPDEYWLDYLPEQSSERAWGGTIQPLTDDLKLESLAIKYRLGAITLYSDSSYLERQSKAPTDETQLFQYFFTGQDFNPGLNSFNATIINYSHTRAIMQEFRVASQDTSRFSWVAGVFYRHSVQQLQQVLGDVNPITVLPQSIFGYPLTNYEYDGQGLSAYANWSTTDISEASFADITVNIFSNLKAAAGVRYEHVVTEHQNQFTAGPLNVPAPTYVVLPDQVANPVTPRFSLTDQLTDQDMVYLSASSGFRPGGGNQNYPSCDADVPGFGQSLKKLGLSTIPGSYNSDNLWTYEAGTKDSFLDRRIALEGSVFYTQWSKIQSTIGLPTCYQQFTMNQGRAISQGFDLQIAAVVTDGLKARILAGYTDAYYPNATYSLPPAGGGAVSILNTAGQKLPNLRPWSAAANAEYSHNLAFWQDTKGYFRVDGRWLSEATKAWDPADGAYDAGIGPHPDEGYKTINLRLGVLHSGLDASVYVDNVTDSDPLLAYSHAAIGDPLYRAFQIRPRTVGITAWYHF